jgi:hypothetical protein
MVLLFEKEHVWRKINFTCEISQPESAKKGRSFFFSKYTSFIMMKYLEMAFVKAKFVNHRILTPSFGVTHMATPLTHACTRTHTHTHRVADNTGIQNRVQN